MVDGSDELDDAAREAALAWIPRSVRAKLDVVGVKLHLAEWQVLPLADRVSLRDLPCGSTAQQQAYSAHLGALVFNHTGHDPEPLAPRGQTGREPNRGVGMAFVVTNRIPVASGHESDFEDRFRKRAHLIDQSPGFIKNLVLRPVQRRFDHATGGWVESKEQGYYLVQTYWESQEDFWNWTKSESFRAAHSNRPPAEMFAGPNVLEIHEVIQNTEAKVG